MMKWCVGGTHLPLGGHATVTSGDTDDEGIKGGQLGGCDNLVVGFRGCVQFCQDFFGKCFGNPDRKSE